MAHADTKTLSAYSILEMTERAMGQRFCNGKCNCLLPLDRFKAKQQPRNVCHVCHKARKMEFYNTQLKLAYNSLLCRARCDRALFGQTKISISLQELLLMIDNTQIESFMTWAIVPKNPSETVTKENSVVVPSYQRRFLVSRWKVHRDPQAYAEELGSFPKNLTGAKTFAGGKSTVAISRPLETPVDQKGVITHPFRS